MLAEAARFAHSESRSESSSESRSESRVEIPPLSNLIDLIAVFQATDASRNERLSAATRHSGLRRLARVPRQRGSVALQAQRIA